MAYAFIQQVQVEGTGAVGSINVTLTPTAGNHLVVVAYSASGPSTSITISDGVNTYNTLASNTNAANYGAIYDAQNVAGGSTTITATTVGGGYMRGLYVREDSGLAGGYITGTGVAALQAAPGTGANAVTTGAITINTVPCALIGFSIATSGASNNPLVGTGFTGRTAVWTTANGSLPEDERLTVSSSPAATWTAQSGGLTYLSFAAAFAEVGAGKIAWVT